MHLVNIILGLSLIALGGCGNNTSKSPDGSAPQAVQITTAKVAQQSLGIYEEAVGSLESVIDPTIAAEISGRVLKILVHPGQTVKKGQTIALIDATDSALLRNEAQNEVARIEALLANQNKVVARNQALVEKNFISKNVLDEAISQQDALKQQLAGAKNHIATINHSTSKSRVVAPADGTVQVQSVAEGDFVRVGDPIAQLMSNKLLRAHLPFPENIAAKLKPGLTIKLSTPTSATEITTTIRELKPQVMSSSRSIDVTADIRDAVDWQPGASVTGRIILGEHRDAITVPEQSVVLRPAGEVVYEIVGDEARQRVVKTGVAENGTIEILEGLKGQELIAVDGAGFLTDQAKVSVIKGSTEKQANN